jgi:hypothetical protein
VPDALLATRTWLIQNFQSTLNCRFTRGALAVPNVAMVFASFRNNCLDTVFSQGEQISKNQSARQRFHAHVDISVGNEARVRLEPLPLPMVRRFDKSVVRRIWPMIRLTRSSLSRCFSMVTRQDWKFAV